MLSYALAIAIAIASLSFFFSAFFAPALHRKDDFLWSGVGLIYALVLWICAEQMRGGVLIGQSAATALLLSFAWQTLRLRRAVAYPDKAHEEFSLTGWFQNRFKSKKAAPKIIPQPTPSVPAQNPTPTEILEQSAAVARETIEEAATDLGDRAETALDSLQSTADALIEQGTESVEKAQNWAEKKIAESPQTKKSGFSLKSLFGGSQATPDAVKSEAIADLIEDSSEEDGEWDEADDNRSTDANAFLEETVATDLSVSTFDIVEVVDAETVKEPEEVPSFESLKRDFQSYVTDNEAETIIESYVDRKSQSHPIENDAIPSIEEVKELKIDSTDWPHDTATPETSPEESSQT
jgi:hypothetical protein